MKKWKKGLLLTIAALALAGCDNNKTSQSTDTTGSDSPISESTSTTDTTSDKTDTEKWTDEEAALMNEYCGGILPKLQLVTGNNVEFQELEDDSGSKFLAIFSESDDFILDDYYTILEKAGWKVIKGYSGNVTQTDSSGLNYIELTYAPSGDTKGYDMVYYYRAAYTDDDGNTVPGCNIIQCYNDMVSDTTDATAWTDKEKASMKDTLTVEVPFVQLGSLSRAYARNSSTYSLIDLYTEDLTLSYSNTLVADGFVLDDKTSTAQDIYVLTKTLTDGATITAYLYYMNGNNFNFFYTPKVTVYSSWPKDALKDIEATTGVTVPQFPVDVGGSYYVFSKNGTLYIQGDTTSYDSWSYEYDLEDIGLTYDDYDSPYTNWEETIAITCNTLVDEYYSQVGLQVAITQTEPSSVMSEGWPSSSIASALTDVLSVSDYTLPELTDLSSLTSTTVKFELHGNDYVNDRYEEILEEILNYPSWYESELPTDYTEDDIKALAKSMAEAEAGFAIKIKDDEDCASYDAYYAILENLGYHKVDGASDGTFEDKDGKVTISLNANSNSMTTTITVTKGSGEKHEPSISFGSESYEIGIGKSQKLQVVKDMLPYDVTYSSSNPEKISVNAAGFVTVSDSASAGDTATITASVTADGKTYTATCTVTAIEVLDYDASSAIASINKLLKTEGYDNAVEGTDNNGSPMLTLTFDTTADTSVTASTLRDLAEQKLIPEGFSIVTSMDVDTGDDVIWQSVSRYEDDVEVGSGMRMGCEFYYQEDEWAKVELSYTVFTRDSDPNTLILEIVAFDTDY